MKKLFAIALLGFMSTTARAAEVSLEDPSFKKLPPAVDAALRSIDATDSKGRLCKLVGKEITLSPSSPQNDFLVTTADGCAWGAAAGPIWLVHKNGARYVVVLESGGVWVKSLSTTTKGLYDVSLSFETAGTAAQSSWRFNGTSYIRISAHTDARK